MKKIKNGSKEITCASINSLADFKKLKYRRKPFACLTVTFKKYPHEERKMITKRLIDYGCEYSCSAGVECGAWELAFDESYLEKYAYSPPEKDVFMTTSHEKKSIRDTIWFFLNVTTHGWASDSFKHYLVLFIGENKEQERKYLQSLKNTK